MKELNENHLVRHLTDLRQCLVRILSVVFIFFLLAFTQAQTLYNLLATPLLNYLPTGSTVIATEITAPFLVPIKLSLFVAVAASIPFCVYFIWNFVAPALYAKEKKWLKEK